MKPIPSPRALPILIYLLPAIADMVVAQFFFINAVRMARLGASATVVANTITIWGITYLMTCPLLGRRVTQTNAARLMMIGLGGLTVISLLFTIIPGAVGIYCLMGCAGAATAFFFVPFQVFMKAVDAGNRKTVAYSTGLYTFAWSFGFACGPFVSGFLMELGSATRPGWMYACWFAAGASAVTGVGVYLLKQLAVRAPTPSSEECDSKGSASAPGIDYSNKPDLAWVGWVAGGTGILVLSFIRGVFPSRAEASLHLSQSLQGLLFFLLSLVQALTGLFLCRSRTWMFGKGGVLAFGLAGVLGALALGFARMPLMLGIGAVLFGLYAGGFFFYLVFHALIHPGRSARYVAINETVVGIASLLGAILGGPVADRFGFGSLYVLGASLIILTLTFQATVTGVKKEFHTGS